MVPDSVLAAWGWQAAELTASSDGLINATFIVRVAGEPIAVLQRQHPVFAGEVNLDIEAVTSHLAARGLTTPRLLRTLDGRAWHVDDRGLPPGGSTAEGQRGLIAAGRPWRALSWVDGVTVHQLPDLAWAEAGGVLVGEFHRAVADLTHDYAFARPGVHDTALHLTRLAEHVAGGGDPEAVALGREVLAAVPGLPAMPDVPLRHCHGDLKISNLRFCASPVRGVCLLDLDTLGYATMAFELGDAMRSWCNPAGEDAEAVSFDLASFAAAIRGFRSVADQLITPDEKTAIVVGLETVCLELSARFAIDVFRDDYFGWDPARFPSRRAHNLARSRNQLALAHAVRDVRGDALEIVRAA